MATVCVLPAGFLASLAPNQVGAFPTRDQERTLRFDKADRRRLVLASALTTAVLPAVWLINRDEAGTTRPNVAAVGLPAGASPSTPSVGTSIDPMGTVEPLYLSEDDSPDAAPVPSVAVGSSEDRLVATGTAIYRRQVGGTGTCLFNGAGVGELVTVVNVANGRSVQCRTSPRQPGAPANELVLHPDAFRTIADLTSAPIDVEIRQ